MCAVLAEKILPDNSKMVVIESSHPLLTLFPKPDLGLFSESTGTHCIFSILQGYYEGYNCIAFVLEKLTFLYGRPNKYMRRQIGVRCREHYDK